MMTYLLLFLGFIFLIKGADLLVDGASSIARKFRVSDLVIGLTVVAFGTSTPELFVNIIAGIKGNTGIAIGNVIGSNIANVLLILGVASVIYPLSVSRGTVWKEIPFSLLAAVVIGIMANDSLIDGRQVSEISRTDGMVLLAFFVIFLYYSFSIAFEIEGMEDEIPSKEHKLPVSLLFVGLGLIGLTFGGKFIVDSAVTIAKQFGMSDTLVGLTVVAVGTSLPELATSIIAAYKKNVEIAVGNVVGSNIFNIFFVLGVSSIIRPLPFGASGLFDLSVMIISGLLLFFFMFTGVRQRLDRWEGAFFIIFYFIYIFVLIKNTGIN